MTFHGMHVPGTPSPEGGDSVRTADLLPTPAPHVGTVVADHFRINELLSQLAAMTQQRDQYGAPAGPGHRATQQSHITNDG